MSRDLAKTAIDSERAYQDVLAPKFLSVGEEVILALRYANKAMEAWSENFSEFDDTPALAELRKVAAICVRAMEHHGCPMRQYTMDDIYHRREGK